LRAEIDFELPFFFSFETTSLHFLAFLETGVRGDYSSEHNRERGEMYDDQSASLGLKEDNGNLSEERSGEKVRIAGSVMA